MPQNHVSSWLLLVQRDLVPHGDSHGQAGAAARAVSLKCWVYRRLGAPSSQATKMFSDHVQWREEHNVDTLLTDFYFNERDKFLEAYPQGYHKLDKMVGNSALNRIIFVRARACAGQRRGRWVPVMHTRAMNSTCHRHPGHNHRWQQSNRN